MEFLKLLICIFAAPIISCTIVLAFSTPRGTKPQKNIKRIFLLNPEQGLAHQRPLWLGLLVPFLYFAILGLFTWPLSNPSISSDGFNNFLSISKLPIAILALSMPIAVLISRLHATQQTALQISETRKKNSVDLFYAHRKALFEYFEKIGEVDFSPAFTGKFHAYPTLHKNAFMGSILEGTPAAKADFFKQAGQKIEEARRSVIGACKADNPIVKLEYLKIASQSLFDCAHMLILPELYEELKKRSFKYTKIDSNNSAIPNTEVIIMGRQFHDLVMAYRYALSFFRHLCDFANYTSIERDRIERETNRDIENVSDYWETEELNYLQLRSQLVSKYRYDDL